MLTLLVTYQSGVTERIDISDNHALADLRTVFSDRRMQPANSVEIIGYERSF